MTLAKTDKILVLTDWYSPGFRAGGPIRSLVNFTQAMKDAYDINILTTNMDFGESTPYPNIDPDKWIQLDEHVHVNYLNQNNLSIGMIYRVLKKNEPGILYLNSMYSVYFSIVPMLLASITRLNYKIILSPRGMLQKGALAHKSFKKYLFLQLVKISGIPKRIKFHATDPQEENDIRALFGNKSNVSI